MTPHRRHLLLTVKTAMDSVPLLYARFRRALLADARTGGPAAVQRQYMARFRQYVAEPRRALVVAVAHRAARLRAAAMVAGAHAHPWVGHPAAPTAAVAAAAQRVALRALTHQRRGGWRITDLEWPSDRYVQGLFFSTWDAWRRRAGGTALRAAADDEDADVDEDAPSIDPARRKIAYPFDEDVTDIDPEELVDDALDDVVVGRGEYYAVAGIRDLAREADHLMSAMETAGLAPQIIGWRWTLSDSHKYSKQGDEVCEMLATADVGHPHGPGVYYDAFLPKSHPNCMCDLTEEWADDDELEDPDWEPPEPDDDYEDQVLALPGQDDGDGSGMFASAA